MFGRAFVNLLGASAVLGAVVAAGMPLGLNAVDRAGAPIACGNALRPSYAVAAKQDQLNLDQATLAGPGFVASDYAAQCSALVGNRRLVVGAVAGAGIVAILAAYGMPGLARRVRESSRDRKAQYAGAPEAVRYQPDHAGVGAQWGADQIGAGLTQPILEEAVGQQIGRHDHAAVAAAALHADSFGDRRGVGRLYAVAGHS